MRTTAMIKRVLQEMLRDKRTLALMFVGPLLILTLMYFLFQSNSDQTADLGVRNVDSSLVKALKNKHIQLHEVTSDKAAEKIIRQHNYAGLLSQKNDRLTLTLKNSDQSKSTILKQSLQKAQLKLKMEASASALKTQKKAIEKLQKALAALIVQTGSSIPSAVTAGQSQHSSTSYSLATHYLYGDKDSNFFDTLLPIMMSFIVFFFVFLISGIALLRERTTGTLKRLLATPVKRGEIIGGYLAGYGLLAMIQTVLIVLYSVYVFKIQILGNIWNVLLINILLAIVALTVGLFISTFASSEFQMMQFIPIIVIPQIFFSGIIPIDQMAGWLQPIAKIMPLYYGANAMSNVIEQGYGLTQIIPNLLALVIFLVFFLLLNLLAMRRYREV